MIIKKFCFRLAAAALAAAGAFSSVPVGAATPASCFTCSPQCVPAARDWSGVNFPKVGYARDIPAASRKAGFVVGNSPPIGQKSVGVIALGSVQHAVAITKATASGNAVKLVLSHANYDCRCGNETVSATFSNGKLRFDSGALKGRSIAAVAFVSNRR